MIKSAVTLKQSALACSLALHASVAAWAAWPCAVADVPQQQVVDIMLVMLSQPAPAQDASPVKQTEELPLPPVAKVASKVQKSVAMHVASAPPTTGPQAPDTTERVAAITDPVFNAAYLHNQPPSYPDDARRDGVEGRVLLDVDVSPQGDAQAVNIEHSSGNKLLDETAQNAVKAWRFVPARRGDTQVDAKVVVPVEFRLE
jgi:protein TonB